MAQLVEDYADKKWITFDPQDINCTSWLKELESYRQMVVKKYSDKLVDNYKAENFNLQEQKALSVLKNERGQILSFASIYFNKNFYPDQSVRIVSRFFKSESIRRDVAHVTLRSSLELIQQQIDFCKKNIKDIRWVFISRELPKGTRYVKKCAQDLLSPYFKEIQWQFSESAYLLCGDINVASCWQSLIYCDLSGRGEVPPFKHSLSVLDWKSKFLASRAQSPIQSRRAQL